MFTILAQNPLKFQKETFAVIDVYCVSVLLLLCCISFDVTAQ